MPAGPRTYNILVVEDNPADVTLIKEAFAESGQPCRLTFTTSIANAQEAIKANAFDLILSDMSVRSEDCEVFIRAIRADPKLRTTPIIVLSGSVNPLGAYHAGANAFVTKSMDIDQFFAKIRALMHFWIEVAELPPSSL